MLRSFYPTLPFAIMALTGFLLSGCGTPYAVPTKGEQTQNSLAGTTPAPVSPAPPGKTPPPQVNLPPTPANPPAAYHVTVPPLWEAHTKDGRSWTLYSYGIVDTYGAALLKGTADIQAFCPKYASLSHNDKLNFWVYLVSAVTKYESAFDPTSRFKEPGMGNDGITGHPVYSEGLLQLSYQDQQGYKFCNTFDWSVDSKLNVNDPRKTIFDPYKNLNCGIRILSQVLSRHNMIAFNSGHYWSTLMPKNSAEHSIQALTNSISFCR